MSNGKHTDKLAKMLGVHGNVLDNPTRERLIHEAQTNREAVVSANGALMPLRLQQHHE